MTTNSSKTSGSSMILIDSRVTGHQMLFDHLVTAGEIFIIDADSDGVVQIAARMQGRSDIDALHIISHGSQGALYLGSTVLSSSNLSMYALQLASIGSALAQSGDVLLYGCNVAQGEKGLGFVKALAVITGADVAASADASGSQLLGGNHILETTMGLVEGTSLDLMNLQILLGANSAPSFSTPVPGTGKLIIPVGAGIDDGRAIKLDGNGKILIAGYSKNGSNNDFSLVRLNADGSLDRSFDGDGKAIIPVGSGNDEAYCITVQSDGKILLGGSSYSVSNYDYSIIRLNANGSLDSSFNSSGKAIIPVGASSDFAYSISIQNDDKILLGGYSEKYGGSDYSLVRLNANGTLDSGFGTGGKALVDVGGSDFAYSLSVQSDGKIVIGGISNEDYSVVRLNANGTLDSGFGIGGKSQVDMGGSDFAYSLGLQGDGKIVLGGHSQNSSVNSYSTLRLNANGTIDSAFGIGGRAIVDVKFDGGIARSLSVQSDGKILLGGWINNNGDSDYGVVRLNADGSLDSTFGNGGKTVIPVGGGRDFAMSLTLQSDGKFLMAGTSYTGSDTDFSLIRLNADGSLDTSFGTTPGSNSLGGTVSYTENAPAIALDTSVAIYDPELTVFNNGQGNYSGASITLARSTGENAQDVFGASGNLSFTGSNVVLSGTTIGSFRQSGGTLNIAFNSNATQARVNEALSSLTYANSSDAPPASVQVNWTFSDGNSGEQGSGGAQTGTGSTTVNITAVNDVPTGSVTVSGTATQGEVLTASNTLADADGIPTSGSGAIAYQWKAGGIAISGAQASTYTLTQAEVGKAITVTASYTDLQGTAESVTSSATIAVANVNDTPIGGVTFTGTATQGQTLTGSNTLADADGIPAAGVGAIKYQWKAGGADILGASASTFILTQTEVGKAITLTASYTDQQGTEERVASAASAVVANVNDAPTGELTIGGTATQGQTLTVINNLVDLDGIPSSGVGSVSYQWKVGGVNIAGATSSIYPLTQAEVGKAISVTASYTDLQGAAELALSASTTPVANLDDVATGTLTVLGSSVVLGGTLTARLTGITDPDGAITNVAYSWQENIGTTENPSWIPIGLMGSSSLSISDPALAGTKVRVVVVTTDATSGTTNFISATKTLLTNDAPTGSITISGTATQGQVLTAGDTLADADGLGTISYQWLADGTNINGATSTTLTLDQAQVGKAISVKASYTDQLGTTESVNSTATASVTKSGTGTSTIAKFWKDNTKAPTDTKKADAVNLTDAIAILKMIVGLNVNSNNTPLSPYQAIAADFDQSGDVGLTDAIGVLKMVVGLSAPTPTWKYYDDIKLNSAYTSAQSLNPKGWTSAAAISDTGTAYSSVKLVGVLTGDVDGSWIGN